MAFALGPVACYSCIAAGVRVTTPGGSVPIEQLRVGDRVMSVDVATGALVGVTVTAIREAERECASLELEDGNTLVCTPDHPVFDPDSGTYRYAGDWVSGEATRLLVELEGNVRRSAVRGRKVYAGVRRVFDLTVDGPHSNFVANGVVVHNKSKADVGPYYPSYDPAWFEDEDSVPCPIPLPDGEACLTVGPKEFHIAEGAASIEQGRTRLSLEPAPGSPSVYLSFTSEQAVPDLPPTHKAASSSSSTAAPASATRALATLRSTWAPSYRCPGARSPGVCRTP